MGRTLATGFIRGTTFILLVSLILSACASASPAAVTAPLPATSAVEAAAPIQAAVGAAPAEPTEEPAGPGPAPTPSASPPPVVIGPGYLPGYNPLTGLPMADPAVLLRKPLLVSVSNFPVSARPQSGLSVTAQVWETYIGEGMTRLLAVFYGDYAERLQAILSNRLAEGGNGFVIGPIRSGRVVFEDIKTLFEGATLITAGASAEVAAQLTNRRSIFGSDPANINSAGVQPSELAGITPANADPAKYASLTFDPHPPAGGKPAGFVRLVYNDLNQVGWTYDAQSGSYLRSQDKADGTGKLVPATDRLTGEPLGFSNVVVMFAQHRIVNRAGTIIEMELLYVRDRNGLLFRDGEMVPVKWSTLGGHLRFTDRDGKVVALKPGPTFFEVFSYQSEWNEAEMEVRYHNPPRP